MEKCVVEQLRWIRKELDKGLVIETYLDRVLKEYDELRNKENTVRGKELRGDSI